jgi:hypothetical protein
MTKINLLKSLLIIIAFYLIAASVQARPEYLRIFAADPDSRPELRGKCSVCHLNPEGGGERNEFGKSFAQAGLSITPELKRRFPGMFLQSEKPPVSFVEGSDAEAIVELNGKRFMINTRDKTVKEIEPVPAQQQTAAAAPAAKRVEAPKIYRPADVRLINLPTTIAIPKGSLWTDFTHRFPFGETTDAATLFGLDTFAIPAFGFVYGVTDRIHIGAYRAPTAVGRPIEIYAGANFLDEQQGDPFSFMARVGLEGRDNFQRNFTTSLEFTFAKSLTRRAQLYFVPTISLGDRPINGDPERNLPGEEAFALGVGGAFNIRPTVALMAEANYRLNEAARYPDIGRGIRRPVFGFGVQKVSASRRHAFSLVFTNGAGTTFSQRSQTRAVQFADDGFQGLTIGFNLTRRLF